MVFSMVFYCEIPWFEGGILEIPLDPAGEEEDVDAPAAWRNGGELRRSANGIYLINIYKPSAFSDFRFFFGNF